MRKILAAAFAWALFLATPVCAETVSFPGASQIVNTWTPVANGFTVVGSAPTLTGFYVKTGLEVTIQVVSVCSGGCTTVASVAGTSFYSGLPFTAANTAAACAGSVNNVTGVSYGGGYANSNLFTPGWTATANTVISTCTFQSTT